MKGSCPHCPPDDVWPHKHVGSTELPLLIIVRDEAAHKEWYFHGTYGQCGAYMLHPNRYKYGDGGQARFEELLLIHKDWNKALEAF